MPRDEVERRRDSGEAPHPEKSPGRNPGDPGSTFGEGSESSESAFSVEPIPVDPEETIAFTPSGDATGSTPARGSVIGDYELIGEIARGGMGAVFLARHLHLKRQVALKMILSGPFAAAEEVRRFLAEAVATASLEHEHIVTVYEVGEHLGYPYFTMKLVSGGSLNEHLEQFRSDPESAVRLVLRVARAVEYAHRQGFVHRDLKPGNILVDDRGMPHVIDFGLAKRVGGERGPGLTQHGATVGTPSYMAPEQAGGRGGDVSAPADVYGLGAILYALLTGRPPFRARTVNETIMQVLDREPEPPRRINPAVPRALEMVVLKCLEKKPERRYPSAEALAADLEHFLQGEPVEAVRIGPLGTLRRWARRNPDLVARGLGIGSVLLITQVNYLLVTNPNLELHVRLTLVEASWLISTLLLGWVERRLQGAEAARACWIVMDVVYATITLRMIEGANTPYVLGYTLLIATSGHWSSVRLVWLTTVASIVGYLAIAYPRPEVSNHYPNIIAALMLVTGLVVAQQVRRLRALNAVPDPRMKP